METVNRNKLKIKDIITVVLLALINVVLFFASSLLYATPITIILMPVFFALLEGIVYFIIGTKVKAGCYPHLQYRPCHSGRISAVHHTFHSLRCHYRTAAVEDRLRQCKSADYRLYHQSGACRIRKHNNTLRYRRKCYGRSSSNRRSSGYYP